MVSRELCGGGIYDTQTLERSAVNEKPQITDSERVAPDPVVDPNTKRLIARSVKGSSLGTARTEIHIRDFTMLVMDEPETSGGTDTGPTPFEVSLAALIGCESVMIAGVATAMGFEYEGVDFEASGTFDLRGPKGVPGIRPFFETVDLMIVLYTEEPPERIERLAKNVEHRCPILNLMRDGGVVVSIDWQIR